MKWISIKNKLPPKDKIVFLKTNDNLIYLIFSDELHKWKETGKCPQAPVGLSATFDLSEDWFWKEAH